MPESHFCQIIFSTLGNGPRAVKYKYTNLFMRASCIRVTVRGRGRKKRRPKHLAPSLSSPHLFVKPSTFSLRLNCFSPSSLRLPLPLSFFLRRIPVVALAHTRTDRPTNLQPTQKLTKGRTDPHHPAVQPWASKAGQTIHHRRTAGFLPLRPPGLGSRRRSGGFPLWMWRAAPCSRGRRLLG